MGSTSYEESVQEIKSRDLDTHGILRDISGNEDVRTRGQWRCSFLRLFANVFLLYRRHPPLTAQED